MPPTVSNGRADAPHIRCEDVRPRMAKAGLDVLTIREKRAIEGAILRRASEIAGLNREQTAVALNVGDPSQISKWWSGEENPQTWRYRNHPKLREALREADAELDGTVEIETVIKVRRTGVR